MTDTEHAAATLEDSVAVVRLALTEVDEALREVSAVDFEDLALILVETRKALDSLRRVESELVKAVGKTGRYGLVEVPGVGAFKIARSKDRKAWDDRGIVGALIDTHMEARGGELPDTPWTVAEWVLEAAGIAYWRTGALKAQGLDPGDFCTETPGRLTVQTLNVADREPSEGGES